MFANFTVNSNTQLTVTVPNDVASGDIEITTQGGKTKFFFSPIFSGITVDKLQTVSGDISGICFISGSNFYRVTDVMFSTTAPGQWTGSSGFKVINSTMISAPVPRDAAWGPVMVKSTGVRGQSQTFLLTDSTSFLLQEDSYRVLLEPGSEPSGTSTERFVPIPLVFGFYPVSGISGDVINISGLAFSGVTGVLLNNLLNINPFTATHTVTDNTGIRVTIPTGNVRGPIKILARSGISITTSRDFTPFVSLTGLVPPSGRTGTAMTLLGHNMFPDIMYSLGGDSYAVTFFGNVTGRFYRTQFVNPRFTGLTGLIPYGAKSGIVAINYDAGAAYNSTVNFRLINEPPTITGVEPKSGSYSGYIHILGSNFYDLSGVRLSGMGVITSITNPTPVASASADSFTFRIPVLTPKLTGEVYTILFHSYVSDYNATGNALLTILDDPIFSGFSGRLLGTSGAFGDRISVTGKNIYKGSKIFVPYTGLSGESGEAIVDSGSFNSTNSRIDFFVPYSARTGLSNIILYNTIGYASGSDFKLINRPQISGLYPTSGEWGTGISISGSFLSNITGIRIGTGISATFSIVTDTGVTFTIPEDSYTDVVTISSLAGESTSTGTSGILLVNVPKVNFSGFTPTRAYSGDQLIFSGTRLHTIDAVLFTGGTDMKLFDYRYFTKVSSTGITMDVPGGVTSGNITLRNPAGLVTSTAFFEPGGIPSISGINPTFGAHNETISVSGSNLSGMYIWFVSPNSGKYVSGLSQSIVGSTGITVSIPREITIGPVMVSGSGRRWGTSPESFIPLPTISGFTPATVQSGNTLTVTGINATRIIHDILFITGNHMFWNGSSGTFSLDLTNASGSNIVDQRTGYSLYTITMDSEIINTGRIFLISDYYSGIITNIATFLTSAISGKVSNILSTNQLSISETAPII